MTNVMRHEATPMIDLRPWSTWIGHWRVPRHEDAAFAGEGVKAQVDIKGVEIAEADKDYGWIESRYFLGT